MRIFWIIWKKSGPLPQPAVFEVRSETAGGLRSTQAIKIRAGRHFRRGSSLFWKLSGAAGEGGTEPGLCCRASGRQNTRNGTFPQTDDGPCTATGQGMTGPDGDADRNRSGTGPVRPGSDSGPARQHHGAAEAGAEPMRVCLPAHETHPTRDRSSGMEDFPDPTDPPHTAGRPGRLRVPLCSPVRRDAVQVPECSGRSASMPYSMIFSAMEATSAALALMPSCSHFCRSPMQPALTKA